MKAQTHLGSRLEYVNTEQVTLRQAAVLVLLTEGPKGLQVLLTERAGALDNYPGQLVFPGGAAERGDGGPVATAIREAEEEAGLDGASIDILGVMSALALFESGFLVHPVLAWAHHPRFSRSMNFAEVSALVEVPLAELAERGRDHGERASSQAVGVVDLKRLGRFTGEVLDLLLAMLSRVEPRPVDAVGTTT